MIIIHSFFDRYKILIEETQLKNKDLIEEIDILLKEIRDHINVLDKRLHDNKKDFMLAIRLVECFRILEWIKVYFHDEFLIPLIIKDTLDKHINSEIEEANIYRLLGDLFLSARFS